MTSSLSPGWRHRCPFCNWTEPDTDAIVYTCGSCGKNVEIEMVLSREIARRLKDSRIPGMDRWRPVLPIRPGTPAIPLLIGDTPLYDSAALAKDTGFSRVLVKDDGRLPSASFKDRASAVAILRAMNLGRKTIVAASTGNAAASLACLSAAVGLRALIFLPAAAPEAKIAQLLVFGATVFAVDGTYDDAFDLSVEATRTFGLFNRNTGLNPFTREGKKLCAYEIAMQMNWSVPDYVLIATGDGNIISGVAKGFFELKTLGLTRAVPRMIAAQSVKSNAIARALKTGTLKPVNATTVADSISVSLPRDGDIAIDCIRRSRGFAIEVSDREILSAIPYLARKAGVFAEPAAACAVAALRKAARSRLIPKRASVLCLISGNGLKDIKSAKSSVQKISKAIPVTRKTALQTLERIL
ncbi:threonine synthase [bacterium]|nr:threonine synthase [bacterium]